MFERKFIAATSQEYQQINQILDIVVNPYEILKCNTKSSIIDISNNYNELLLKEGENENKNEQYINKLHSAYSLLSNERLREIYDYYYYNKNFMKTRLIKYSILLTQPIFCSLSDIAISPIYRGNLKDIVSEIYKEKGIFGFYNRIGGKVVMVSIFNHFKFKYFNGSPYGKMFDYTLDYLCFLNSIAPLSLSTSILIKTFILKRTIYPLLSNYKIFENVFEKSAASESSICITNFKNIFTSLLYSITVHYLVVRADRLFFIIKYYLNQQSKSTDNKLICGANFLFSNLFTSCAIRSLFTLPLHMLYSEYPAMLLSNQFILPSPLNPIQVVIKLLNYQNRRSSISRISNAFIPNFFEKMALSLSL